MALALTSGPLSEPLTLDEVKQHLRIDGTNEDALLASLILTSRLHIETALGLALLQQSWRLSLDAWPRSGFILMPLSPVLAVSEIRVAADMGPATVVDAAAYQVDAASRPARIAFDASHVPQPKGLVNGIEIDFTAGFGMAAGDVPEPVRLALLLLVAHWYEHRDPIEIGMPSTAIPQAVGRLLAPYRVVRL
ncbi:MAG: head-tail connector protein [Hyphomicrobiaceae bacterium]